MRILILAEAATWHLEIKQGAPDKETKNSVFA